MELTIQLSAVLLLIGAASAYLGVRAWRSARKFESKNGCGPDCGCGKN